jgi:hypothetical protein
MVNNNISSFREDLCWFEIESLLASTRHIFLFFVTEKLFSHFFYIIKNILISNYDFLEEKKVNLIFFFLFILGKFDFGC